MHSVSQVNIPTPATDNDFFSYLQLIGSNLIEAGDSTILGLRCMDATSSSITSMPINSRYPVTRGSRSISECGPSGPYQHEHVLGQSAQSTLTESRIGVEHTGFMYRLDAEISSKQPVDFAR